MSKSVAPESCMQKSVVLVGMMGAGKSHLGRKLANALHCPFTDADKEIEQAANMPIAEIFAKYGEAHFRDGEKRVLARLLADSPQVIAAGGGAFVQDDTRALIQENAVSVWLNAAPSLLYERLARNPEKRPLLQGDPATRNQRIDALLAERKRFYEQAHITLSFADEQDDTMITELIEKLPSDATN